MGTVMLIGAGGVGSWALEFLVRSPLVERVILVRRSSSSGPLASLALVGARLAGHATRVESQKIDIIEQHEEMSRLLRRSKPDVIINTATVKSPRLFKRLAALEEEAEFPFGVFLPFHLAPMLALQSEVIASGIDARVVNVSFPDVVNVVLHRHFGHGPTVGAGNAEISAAVLEAYVCEREAVATVTLWGLVGNLA